MGMIVGIKGEVKPDINVTPLIDVLLVLLIIFMVITPLTPLGLETLVPQPPKDQKQEQKPTETIVVQVLKGNGKLPQIKINQTPTTVDKLGEALSTIFKSRGEDQRIMFVKGDSEVEYEYVAQVIDIAHGAGAQKIGLITAKIEAGQ